MQHIPHDKKLIMTGTNVGAQQKNRNSENVSPSHLKGVFRIEVVKSLNQASDYKQCIEELYKTRNRCCDAD